MSPKPVKPKQLTVDVRNRAQLRAWASYWGCTQQDVRDAARSTGGVVADVDDWLRINVVR